MNKYFKIAALMFCGTQLASNSFAQTKKVVLITGAANGIGKATALAFAQKGYITYATDKDTSQMQDLEAAGCKIKYIDVTIENVMVSAIKDIENETGGIDILVNNAGYGQNGVIEELSLDAIRRQFEVNVFGLLRMTQLVLPKMRERQSGRIINIGSVGGEFTTPGASAYHASKWALESFNDGLRGELRQFGIEVILVKPGGVRTNFMNTANKMYPKPMEKSPYLDFREKFIKQSNDILTQIKNLMASFCPIKLPKSLSKRLKKRSLKQGIELGYWLK
jgi:short-subunit dehydrogenase